MPGRSRSRLSGTLSKNSKPPDLHLLDGSQREVQEDGLLHPAVHHPVLAASLGDAYLAAIERGDGVEDGGLGRGIGQARANRRRRHGRGMRGGRGSGRSQEAPSGSFPSPGLSLKAGPVAVGDEESRPWGMPGLRIEGRAAAVGGAALRRSPARVDGGPHQLHGEGHARGRKSRARPRGGPGAGPRAQPPRGHAGFLVERSREFDKSLMIRFALYPLGGEGLFTSRGNLWKRQRRLMAPLFHPGQDRRLRRGHGRLHGPRARRVAPRRGALAPARDDAHHHEHRRQDPLSVRYLQRGGRDRARAHGRAGVRRR